MDRVFVERVAGDKYQIAVVDRGRIFAAKNPGTLATVFECSKLTPTSADDAQIFYALAPSIGADDFFVDFCESHRSYKLNHWSIVIKDRNIANLFQALEPLNRVHRLNLYSERHSISPEETITSNSKSLFSLVSFSDQQKWKTGILQRCIDSLVLLDHREKAKVYAVLDEEYRRIMRFKMETESDKLPDIRNTALVLFMRRIIQLLGLKNSHDPTIFHEIPTEVTKLVKVFRRNVSVYTKQGTPKEELSDILTIWSGASIKEISNEYQLEVNPVVIEGLSYMQPWLSHPEVLTITETPM